MSDPAPTGNAGEIPRRWRIAAWTLAAFLAVFGTLNQIAQLTDAPNTPGGAFVWPGALLVIAAIGTALVHEWALKLGFSLCLMNFVTSGIGVWSSLPAWPPAIEIVFLAACAYGMAGCWLLLAVARRCTPGG